MTAIPLTHGMVALIDDVDWPLVAGHKWYADRHHGKWYARAKIGPKGQKRAVKMHRLILPGLPMIDHRDGDGLNNQRHNLRACTQSQNMANQTSRRGRSRFKGVRPYRGSRWWAVIACDGRRTRLGTFDCEVEAAKAYNAAAVRLFGEYARLNEINDTKGR